MENGMVNNQILPYGELTLGDENLLRKYGVECQNNAKWKSPVAVELGTFFGRGAAILSGYFKQVRTIDVHEDLSLIDNEASRVHYEEHIATFPRTHDVIKENLKRFPSIVCIQSDTKFYGECDFEVKGNDLCLLFIDADHTFEGVKADYNSWYPKVVPGGYIIIHDSGPGAKWLEPGLFCRTITNAEQIDESDCSTVWRKPE